MLAYLSRVSLCLAALAAGASLFTPGRDGAALASLAIVALIGALLMRRFRVKAQLALRIEPDQAGPLDDTALHEVATLITRRIAQASTLPDALRETREELIHELGARGVVVHGPADDMMPLALAQRFPLGEALRSTKVAGNPTLGYAAPVVHDGQVVAMLELKGVELDVEPQALVRLLALVKGQLEGVALRDGAAGPATESDPQRQAIADLVHQSPLGSEGEFLNVLTENLPISLFVFEPGDRRILAINRHAEQEFSLKRSEMIGKTLREFFEFRLAELAEPAMLQAMRQHAPVDVDCEWPSRRLGLRTVNIRNVVLRYADGSPRLLLVIAREVTAERRDRRELEESQARYTELAETVEDTLFVSNPDRSHFEFISSGAFDTYGISRSAFNADHAAIFTNLVEEDRVLLAGQRNREARGEAVAITYRIQHPAKGLRWLRSRTRSRVLPDGTMRVYGLVSDVTRDHQHEVELEAARDVAEAASQAKSQFMANMSHEIRTPMNGILGMTELLLGTPLNDKQRRFAKAVYRSGESLLEIINDILDFSKIEAGKLELAPTDFSLRGVVEDTLELLAPRAREKGLELSFHEAPGLPASVHGDPLRLQQVLTNLIANAIKFTERGEVVVELKLRAPSEAPLSDSGFVLGFQVRDTGIGIDADTLPRLFTAFTQANGGMSRRYGGTGLGLAISKQLIELMGGSIRVESRPGIGSQFIFEVPVRPAAGENAMVELDAAELAALRVLVVEDHETNRTVLENMLGAWGMDVTLAEDGQQALDILQGRTEFDTHYDLALVDMHMPRLDGVSFGHALKAAGTHPDLKMILLSSVSSPDDVRTAQLAGFHRFVAKPVRKVELWQAILGASAQRRETVAMPPRLRGHVLIVEDNPVNQEVIGQMLRHLGLKVRVEAGALQGLRALCEAHFDLVLMDVQMPGMDGVEALSWFRRGNSDRFSFVTPSHTPVIAVTANALGGDQDRFLALGFDDYLSKPFRQSQLLAMLTKRLSPHSPVPSDEAAASGGADPAWANVANSVLDASALDRLRELDPKGENHLLSRVIKAFENSAARLMPQLQESRRAGDNTGVRHVAHTLKSSSASIGGIKLSQLCAEVEIKIRTDKLENLDELIDAMCAEVEIVLQALKRLLDGKT
jgi:two-component system sensor histidine kinase/response regulator